MKSSDFLFEPLWYNDLFRIGNNSIFYKEFFQRGVTCVKDLLNVNGEFYGHQQFTEQFDIKCNFLTYNCLITMIKSKDFTSYQTTNNFCCFPLLPSTIKIFYKHQKGARDMYNILTNETKYTPSGKTKWNETFNISDMEWATIFKTPFIVTQDSKLQWFQTRINHYILGTNVLLNKIDPSVSDKCYFCKRESENIEHLFWECTKVQDILIALERELDNKTITLSYNKATFIFGFFNNKKLNIANNTIIIWIKYYIYKTKYQEGTLSINALLNFLNFNYKCLRTAYMSNNQNTKFEDMWKQFQQLF